MVPRRQSSNFPHCPTATLTSGLRPAELEEHVSERISDDLAAADALGALLSPKRTEERVQ